MILQRKFLRSTLCNNYTGENYYIVHNVIINYVVHSVIIILEIIIKVIMYYIM